MMKIVPSRQSLLHLLLLIAASSFWPLTYFFLIHVLRHLLGIVVFILHTHIQEINAAFVPSV
jgi:hypothetical protein